MHYGPGQQPRDEIIYNIGGRAGPPKTLVHEVEHNAGIGHNGDADHIMEEGVSFR